MPPLEERVIPSNRFPDLAAFLRPLLLVLLCGAPAFAESSLEDLTRQFASDDADARESALSEVIDRFATWTETDLAALESVAAHGEPESAARARRSLEGIRWRRQLGPRLAEVLEKHGGPQAETPEGASMLLTLGGHGLWTGNWTEEQLTEFVAIARKRGWTDAGLDTISIIESCAANSYAPLLSTWLDDPKDAVGHEELLFRAIIACRATGRAAWVASCLENPAESVRGQAARALGLLGARDHAPELVHALGDQGFLVPCLALIALQRLNALPPAAEIAKLLRSSHFTNREEAMTVLCASGNKEYLPEFPAILDGVAASELPKTVSIVRAVDPAAGAAAIRKRLQADPGFLGQATSAARLGIRTPELLPEAVALLKSPVASVRTAAVQFIGSMQFREAAGGAAKLLDDPDFEVRFAAEFALGKLGARDQAKRLVGLIGKPASPDKGQLFITLGNLGAWQQVDSIVSGLKSDETCRAAAFALKALDAHEQADALLPLLENENADVRWVAAQALGSIGSRKHSSHLEALLKDPEASVRESATLSLFQIGRGDVVLNCRASSPDMDIRLTEEVCAEMLQSHETSALFLERWDAGSIGYSADDLLWLPLPPAGDWNPADRAEILRRFRNIEHDGNPDRSLAASVILLRCGESAREPLAALLERVADRPEAPGDVFRSAVLEAMSAAREPKGYAVVAEEKVLGRQVVTEEDLRVLLKERGLDFDPGNLVLHGRHSPLCSVSIRDILREALFLSGSTWVLDGTSVRVLPAEEAVHFWRSRLPGK